MTTEDNKAIQLQAACDRVLKAMEEQNGGERVGLMKRGYWYRPDACGYTDRESEAGRYTMEEAKKYEYLRGDEPVKIVRFTKANLLDDANRGMLVAFVVGLPEKMRPNFIANLTNYVGNRMTESAWAWEIFTAPASAIITALDKTLEAMGVEKGVGE